MILPVFTWHVVAGLVGASSRLMVQTYNNDGYQGSWQRAVSLLFLGCVGGWVAYLIDPGFLSSAALGYTAADTLENIFGKNSPEG